MRGYDRIFLFLRPTKKNTPSTIENTRRGKESGPIFTFLYPIEGD
ncbi:hypothetical protein HMPREF1554_01953 [Porphyromonas gingivalis F0569]|nr:hypothetical protein HMPREF1554_01953 [Porphyromonas gingivalis F0569]